MGGGTSSRRAGTRALPELHPAKAGLELLSGRFLCTTNPRRPPVRRLVLGFSAHRPGGIASSSGSCQAAAGSYRSRGRVVNADKNVPLGCGTSSRRAGTRALPEFHSATARLELLLVSCPINNVAFAVGQLAVFQGVSEVPISGSYGSSEQRGKTANWPRPGGLR